MSEDDIVTRLREGAQTPYGLPVQSDEARLHIAAADEITRLRADLAAAREGRLTLTPEGRDELIAELCDENNKLRAELAAARELLKTILDASPQANMTPLLARIDAVLKRDGDE